MTAEHILDRWRAHGGWGWSFYLLCLFPVLTGVLVRLMHHGWVLMDIDAVLCAAHHSGLGLSPYATQPACPGLAPAAYVYAPQWATMLAPLTQTLGLTTARLVYVGVLLIPAMAFLVWFALFKSLGIATSYRWLAFSALTPMTFCCGNIGLIMHSGVLASWLLSRRRWLFVAVVIACAAIKPTFLAYLIVLLLEDRSWRRRGRDFAIAGVAGAAVVGLVFVTAGVYGGAWRDALHAVALQDQPGLGWLALMAWLGIPAGSSAMVALTVTFMIAMVGAGLAIARWSGLDRDARWLLGFGLAPLLTPRLMDYDMLMIVPFAALIMQAGQCAGLRLGWVYTTILSIGIVANIVEFKAWHRTHIAMFLFAALTLNIGVCLTWAALQRRKSEESPLLSGGEGDRVPVRRPIRALFNPVSRWRL